MANPVPAGSDVSSGTYRCTQCEYELSVQSTKHLPPCPSCGNGEYLTLTGGDSASDPYPGDAKSSTGSTTGSSTGSGSA